MYIAIEQFNPKVGALKENSERALARVAQLAASPYPPDLVIFPPFCLTGAPVLGLQTHDAFSAECLDVLNDFGERAALPTLLGSLYPNRQADDSFVSLPEIVFCSNGKAETLHFADSFERTFDQDFDLLPWFTLADQTVSVLFDEVFDQDEDLSDSDIVIMLTAKEYVDASSMLNTPSRIEQLCGVAVRNAIWIVCLNLLGGQDNLIFPGVGIVISPNGTVVAATEPFVEQSLLVNLTQTAPEIKLHPLLPYEGDWRALGLGIRDYLNKNDFSDCVLGLSGGIDSAVTAVLAVDALGAEHVHAVLMPSEYSSQGSVDDALRLAANLGITTLTLPITSTYEAFLGLYQDVLGEPGSDLAIQNIQARIRTIHLMHLSNSYGWLLLNTGNKSEAAMGYSTLYGDTAGAFAPLGNIYKTDVYGLARWRNQRFGVIPCEILDKPPSAELYAGQKDSDSLPDYEVLDRILRLHIDRDLGLDQIITWFRVVDHDPTITPELVSDVLNKVRLAEFKRRQEPLAPCLSSLDMTNDRLWPVTNGFTDKNRNLPTASEVFDFLGDLYGEHGPRGHSLWQN